MPGSLAGPQAQSSDQVDSSWPTEDNDARLAPCHSAGVSSSRHVAALGLSRDQGLGRHLRVPKIVFSFHNSLGGLRRSEKLLHSWVWFIAAKRGDRRREEGRGAGSGRGQAWKPRLSSPSGQC